MLQQIIWACLMLLACIGAIHSCCWVWLRKSCRHARCFRVFPIGGKDKNADRQMADFYRFVQWEDNPTGQRYILFDNGMEERQIQECAEMARGLGVTFARGQAELLGIFAGKDEG